MHCNLLPDINPEKKVRFSESFVVYDNIPWKQQNTFRSPLFDNENLLPLKSCIKDNDQYSSKINADGGESVNCLGIIVLLVFLLLVFLIIWWILSRLLLLEMESQVSSKQLNTIVSSHFSSLYFFIKSFYNYIDYL